MTHVVVIGAGIIGVSTSLWLRRAGFDVTLIDKGTPGMGASYGNGCILASCSVVPVTGPGLIKNAPKMLRDPNFPLFLRWRYLPKLVPWLVQYLGHANTDDTRRISQGLTQIVGDSLEQHQALSAGTSAARWVCESKYSFAYSDRQAFEKDKFTWQLRAEAGFVPDIIEGGAVREEEPILGANTKLLAVLKNHGFILNPAEYVQELVKVLTEMGGKFVQAEVTDFTIENETITSVDTTAGQFHCDRAVVSSGIWSRPLIEKLGLKVPLEAERGYHIVFKNPTQKPRNPMMLAAGKFVATAMNQGVRCSGVVEFGGLSPQKSKAPLQLLRKKVKEIFPKFEYESDEEWLGFRPAPTDSLPLLGQVKNSGIYTAFGHHHIGLTGGPKTGRMVADMIAGKPANADLRPFEPQRFS